MHLEGSLFSVEALCFLDFTAFGREFEVMVFSLSSTHDGSFFLFFGAFGDIEIRSCLKMLSGMMMESI